MARETVAAVAGYEQEQMKRPVQYETPFLEAEAMIFWRWETKAMNF